MNCHVLDQPSLSFISFSTFWASQSISLVVFFHVLLHKRKLCACEITMVASLYSFHVSHHVTFHLCHAWACEVAVITFITTAQPMIVGFVLLHFLVCFKLPFTSLQFTEPVINFMMIKTVGHSFMLHHMFEKLFGKLEAFGAHDALVSLMLFEISRFFVFRSITVCSISLHSFQF